MNITCRTSFESEQHLGQYTMYWTEGRGPRCFSDSMSDIPAKLLTATVEEFLTTEHLTSPRYVAAHQVSRARLEHLREVLSPAEVDQRIAYMRSRQIIGDWTGLGRS